MTKGQVEAKISEVVTKFEVEIIGRGPREINSIIVEDLIVIRQKGFFSKAEQRLAEKKNGVDLLKKVRTRLFESEIDNFKDMIKKIIKEIVDIDIVSIHSDVSTKTGEKIIVITVSKNLENEIKSL